jgi:hypothetical protein
MRRYIILTNIALFILFIFLSIKGYNEARELILIKKGNLGIEGNIDYNQTKDGLPASFIAGIGHSSDYYNVIPEKNLFRPERKEYESPLPLSSEEDSEEINVEDEIKPPAVDLYGIMIEGQKKTALLFDKRETDKNLQYKVVSPETTIQDFKLIRIEPNQLIFEKQGRKAILELSHKKYARGGVMSVESKKSPTVITTEGKGAKTKDSKLAVSVESSEKGTSKISSTKKRSDKEGEEDNAEYKIIDTPFGKVKRKVKK